VLIQPGQGLPSVSNFIELVPVNSKRRIDVKLLNDSGNPSDISEVMLPSGDADGELAVELTSLGGTAVFSESYWPNPVPSSRRIKHLSTGHYYVQLGDVASETATSGTYVANWTVREASDKETAYRTQVIEIVTPRVLSLLPRLRYVVDKSLKIVVPDSQCYLGYTDSALVLALRSGIEMLNTYQPYVSWTSIDAFPIETYSEILIKAATYFTLESQMLFALDTDQANFSVSGHSYSLLHQAPLASYLSQLKAELDSRVPNFKLHFVNSGTAMIEARPDLAFASLLSAAPYGSLFRGIYSSR
jgi:hypothetical protein